MEMLSWNIVKNVVWFREVGEGEGEGKEKRMWSIERSTSRRE